MSPHATSNDPDATMYATLNGEYHVLGSVIMAEGSYTLVVTASTADGESVTEVVAFRLDYTPPEIIVGGVVHGGLYSEAVRPTFSTEDEAVVTALLHGKPFVSGATVQGDGVYELKLLAVDAAGNTASKTIVFTIDMPKPPPGGGGGGGGGEIDPPDLTVLGVLDGDTYAQPVTPYASTPDDTTVLVATLNGDYFLLGTTVFAEGSYTLVVTATDVYGGVTTKTVLFEIDYSSQNVDVSLVVDVDLYGFTLSWEAVGQHAPASYTVYRALSAADLPVGSVIASTVSSTLTDASVSSRTQYHYQVVAFSAQGRQVGASNVVTAQIDPSVDRMWGEDRILTSVDISRQTFTSGDTVILATGGSFADALSASGLAGSYQAPILLTRANSLPEQVRREIVRLDAARVIIIGGTQAVGDNVELSLRDMGLDVLRLAGPTRYETAVAIAEEIDRNERAEGRSRSGQVFLARGDTFPDALSVSPLAYSQRAPVLFTRPDSLPAGVRSYARRAGFTSVLVAGGTSAVSDAVVADFAAASGATVTRAGGADRYATSMAVSQTGVDQQWAQWRSLGIATGTNFPDALSGSVNTGEAGGVLLLTPTDRLDPQIAALLADHPGIVFDVTIYGGPVAVAADVEMALRGLLIY